MLDTLHEMQSKLNENRSIRSLGRLFSENILLKIDGVEYYLVFNEGALERILVGPSKKIPYRFGYFIDKEALSEFWKVRPKPGFHDLFALVKFGRAEIVGDVLVLVKNLRFFKSFMELHRAERGDVI